MQGRDTLLEPVAERLDDPLLALAAAVHDTAPLAGPQAKKNAKADGKGKGKALEAALSDNHLLALAAAVPDTAPLAGPQAKKAIKAKGNAKKNTKACNCPQLCCQCAMQCVNSRSFMVWNAVVRVMMYALHQKGLVIGQEAD